MILKILNFIDKPPFSGAYRLCDMWSLISAGAGNLVDIGTSIYNAAQSAQINTTNLDFAREENEKSRQFARDQLAENVRQLDVQRQYAANEAEKAWERQIGYDSPVNQVKLLREAGLNPAMVLGNGAMAQGSAVSPHAAPTSSGLSSAVPGTMSAHASPYFFPSPTEGLRNLGETLKSIAEAEKLGLENKQLKGSYDDVMKRIKAEGDLAELAASLQSRYADKERSTALKQRDVEIAKSAQDIMLLAKEGQFKDAQIELTKLQGRTEKERARLTEHDANIAAKEDETFYKVFHAKLENMKAQILSSSAMAALNSETAQQMRLMRDYNVQLKSQLQQMSAVELDKTKRTIDAEINYMLGHYDFLSDSEKQELRKVQAEANQAEFEDQMKVFNMAFDKIERVNNGVNKWMPWAFSR